MTYVAFFRNLNQGQRNSPTGAALVEAFARSGATEVATFQTNGTVIFDSEDPHQSIADVIDILGGGSLWRDVAFVRSRQSLVALVDDIEIDRDIDPRRCELSLFDESVSLVDRLPIVGRRCQVVSGGAGFAVTINERPNESNATPTLERVIGRPVSSRGVPTIHRLIQHLDERDETT